jgi:hypothetical protein
MPRKFAASDEFIAWAQSLSGMLTKLRTEYGSIAEMVEHPAWDEGKTEYAMSLVKSLRKHLSKMDTELSSHVEEKFSKKQR